MKSSELENSLLLSSYKRFVALSPKINYFILMDVFKLQANLNVYSQLQNVTSERISHLSLYQRKM